jgi:urate oxidase
MIAHRRRDKVHNQVMALLGTNQYGKAEVHMVTVARDGSRHTLRDLLVSIALSGDLVDVHTTGDNSHVIPTDTQKNTVFAFAKEQPVGTIEEFALRLGRHFIREFASITRARVRIESVDWERIELDGRPHDHAFRAAGSEKRVAITVSEAGDDWVVSGLQDLVVLKSSGSEFHGYIKDRYTTLKETTDRILATAVTARWRHTDTATDWDASFVAARTALLERFADTHSLSLQQTLYQMAGGVIESGTGIVEARLSLPNRHHFAVDLEPFGLENDNEVFRVEDRPYGLIEAVVLAPDAPPAGAVWDPYPLVW